MTCEIEIHTIGQSARPRKGLMLKEQYFTETSIDARAAEMRQVAEEVATRRSRFDFSPARSALLILDMQSYFLDNTSHAYVPSALAIIPRVAALLAAFNGQKLPVFYTRHVNTAQNAHLMSSWWSELILSDNPLSRIVPELKSAQGEIIEKNQYDAFFDTPLEDLLKNKGISQVVISGVMTHLCCESTARSAFIRGFEVFFLVDGTATYNEFFHRASLINLSHGFAEICLVSEIMVKLEDATRA